MLVRMNLERHVTRKESRTSQEEGNSEYEDDQVVVDACSEELSCADFVCDTYKEIEDCNKGSSLSPVTENKKGGNKGFNDGDDFVYGFCSRSSEGSV